MDPTYTDGDVTIINLVDPLRQPEFTVAFESRGPVTKAILEMTTANHTTSIEMLSPGYAAILAEVFMEMTNVLVMTNREGLDLHDALLCIKEPERYEGQITGELTVDRILGQIDDDM